MRERKYVKFKVDMYSDTKFKIIDRRPNRDLIHYAWNRVVILAGKVNLEGDLYLSRNIPYTIETLAIEFNREVNEIKLALDVLIELEMMELTEGKIYRVKNFAKHQNIKVTPKDKIQDKDTDVKISEVQINDTSKVEIDDNKSEISSNINQEEILMHENSHTVNLEIIPKATRKVGDDTNHMKSNDNVQKDVSLLLKPSKRNKVKEKKKKDDLSNIVEEETKDSSYFSDGEWTLGKDERLISSWTF